MLIFKSYKRELTDKVACCKITFKHKFSRQTLTDINTSRDDCLEISNCKINVSCQRNKRSNNRLNPGLKAACLRQSANTISLPRRVEFYTNPVKHTTSAQKGVGRCIV